MIFKLNKRKATGLTYPTDSPTMLFKLNHTTIDQIKSNLVYFLNLKQNDIPFELSKYCVIHNYEYNNITSNNLSMVQNELVEQLQLFFPYLSDIRADLTVYQNTLNVTLSMSYFDANLIIDESITI